MELDITGLKELQKKFSSYKKMVKSTEGKVGTKLNYAPMVAHAKTQLKVHAGRWKTDEQILAMHKSKIIKYFNDSISQANKKNILNDNPLLDPMKKSVNLIHTTIATYPPPRASQRYVRTGTFGRLWTTKVTEK